MLITDILKNSAHNFKDKYYIRQGERTLTYGELDRKTTIMGRQLVTLGQKELMGIMVKNSIEYILCYFGIIRSGNIAVGINLKSKEKSLKNLLEQGITTLFVSQDHLNEILKLSKEMTDNIQIYIIEGITGIKKKKCSAYSDLFEESNEFEGKGLPVIHEDDIAQVIFTSGTNGEPNGVCLTHKNLITNMNQIISRIEIRESDNMLVILPFYYSYGNSLILSHLVKGAQLTLNMNSLLPSLILNDLKKYDCTSLAGVASNFTMLLKRTAFMTEPLDCLRYVTLAGEPVSDWILEELRLKDVDTYVMYGQTEASARISILNRQEYIKKKGSVGKALDGEKIVILDSNNDPVKEGEYGEVLVSGDNIMKGYLNNELLTNQKIIDGFLHTGDFGKLDNEGYLFIKGRKDDMIKVGGERIFPIEIEKIILTHKKVKEVGVVGIVESSLGLGSYLGQTIYAFIVAHDDLTQSEILQHCKENLPINKIPEKIIFAKELTRTNTGKLKRNALYTILPSEEE